MRLSSKLYLSNLAYDLISKNSGILDKAALRNYADLQNYTTEDYTNIINGTYNPTLTYTPYLEKTSSSQPPTTRKLTPAEVDEVYNYVMTLPLIKSAKNLDTKYLRNSIATLDWDERNLEAVRNGTYTPNLSTNTITYTLSDVLGHSENNDALDSLLNLAKQELLLYYALKGDPKAQEALIRDYGYKNTTTYYLANMGGGKGHPIPIYKFTDSEGLQYSLDDLEKLSKEDIINDYLDKLEDAYNLYGVGDPTDAPNKELLELILLRGAGKAINPNAFKKLKDIYIAYRNFKKAAKDYKSNLSTDLNTNYNDPYQDLSSLLDLSYNPSKPPKLSKSTWLNIKVKKSRGIMNKSDRVRLFKKKGYKQVDLKQVAENKGIDLTDGNYLYAFLFPDGTINIFKLGNKIIPKKFSKLNTRK